ncbi:aromatic-ring hydroxylase C-terminal domain-containing protein [Streptomyces silvisoli]|uniref:Monooxygenase n=1 Tax=Streptomyces silvisoli TaxID=3034235 RepID=A0ABT5ZGF7_9ACTN|nr:hypothetical protein [Streptomyces silvisoli]MDF3288083.1 hypothetical protein [Streptomyces silvisoli]
MTLRHELSGDHPWIGRIAPDVTLGDGSRLSERGHSGGFVLLDRTADGALAALGADWHGRVATVVDATASARSGLLVRPDGIVAWAADHADPSGAEAALRCWAGEPVRRQVA